VGWDDVEREADRLYRAAGLDPAVGAPPSTLVRALLGPGSIRFVEERWLPGGGSLARVGSEWRVYLRKGLSGPELRFISLHELSHWALGPSGSEAECDALAARLLAPRAAFEIAMRETGGSYTRLARWFRCTETFAALRYGEVTDQPLVVVAPATIRIRGQQWSWPSEPELRRLADRPRPRGLRKARLRDAPLRVALRVG
jgi:hypothetical protein